jgi:cobalamin biosynthesis protein CobD/CbiB
MCRLQFSETASFWKEVKVASEIRVIQAAMAPAVRGVISHLSEAKNQSAEDVNSKCVICAMSSILEVILHNTKRQRSLSKLASMACLEHDDMDKEKDHLKFLNYL